MDWRWTMQGAPRSMGELDLFVVCLDENGDHVWEWHEPSPGRVMPRDMSVDPSGNLYVVGTLHGEIRFGGATVTSTTDRDVFVFTLAPDGSPVSAWTVPSPGHDSVEGITVGPDGGQYIAGYFREEVDFGGGPRVATAVDSAFAVAFEPQPAASMRWDWTSAAGQRARALDVGLVDGRNVVITGTVLIDGINQIFITWLRNL